MNVTVDPNVPLLVISESLKQVLDIVDFRMEFNIRVDPLSV